MGKSQAALDQRCVYIPGRLISCWKMDRVEELINKSMLNAIPQHLGWELCHYEMVSSNSIENQLCFSALFIGKKLCPKSFSNLKCQSLWLTTDLGLNLPVATIVSEVVNLLSTSFAMSLFYFAVKISTPGMCPWIPISICWWTRLANLEGQGKDPSNALF